MKNVTDANFDDAVSKSDVPVVAYFWAPWCRSCTGYSPIIEEVAKEYERAVKFIKMNAAENSKTVMKLSITKTPATLLLKRGKLKAINCSAMSKKALKNWINELLH